jgi:hypothetical protein
MEAHFVEQDGKVGWPIGYRYRIPQHKSLNERISRAKEFQKNYDITEIPMFVDSWNNDFNNKYQAWPDALHMIKDGKLMFTGQLEHGGIRHHPWSKDLEKLLL